MKTKAKKHQFRVGDRVVLGRHKKVNGDTFWTSEMNTHVGQVATIKGLYDKSVFGEAVAAVEENDWAWRTENMTLAKPAKPKPPTDAEMLTFAIRKGVVYMPQAGGSAFLPVRTRREIRAAMRGKK